MLLRLTLVTPRAAVDVVVEAEPGTPAGAARAGLLAAAGLPAGAALTCRGRAVDDHLVLGLPPLVDGAVVRGDRRPDRARPPAGAVGGAVEVRVVAGPDAGGVRRVGHGVHPVGRAAGCTVRVDDAALSREHARLVVGEGGVDVVDTGSTNGTRSEPDTAGGLRVRLGATTLHVTQPSPVEPAATRPRGDGTVAVTPSPRRAPRLPQVSLRVPPPPVPRDRARVPWVAALLPLVVAVPLVALWGPTALLLGLTSPVLVLGTSWADRRASAADHARRWEEHESRVADVAERHAAALAGEREARHAAAPDPATVGDLARGPRRGLWCRRPREEDHLELRLGLGRVRSRTRVEVPPDREASTAGQPWLDALADDGTTVLDDVPLTVRLADVGVLGICGAVPRVAGLLRSLVIQLAVLHSPRDVQVAVVAPDGPGAGDWGWARWLPHTTASAALPRTGAGRGPGTLVAGDLADGHALVADVAAEVRRRRGEPPGTSRWPGPWLVLLLTGGAGPGRYPDLTPVLEDGPCVGVLTVCAADDEAGLPSACAAVAVLTEPSPGVAHDLVVRPPDGDEALQGVADRVRLPWAQDVARALAPLRDPGGRAAAGSLPEAVRLVDLLDGGRGSGPEEIRARWRARPRDTAAVLGATATGRWVVDLRRDGPHVLVAGTTGAGKSELLRTLVASLAWVNRPDELQLVLVDFKGGAAFAGCADLPHTAGVVTDLDRHLTERVLTSLRAEITRRERLLAAHGALDLDRYLAAVDAGRAPRLPRLVVVVDEFRALAEELPDLLGGLVRLAAVGRSLGVHLVLATQRPGGVVGPDLRANVNLRIALRVRDVTDAHDVVESAAAARICATTPGRAVVRCGAEPLLEVQAALVSGTARAARPVSVRRVGTEGAVRVDPAPPHEAAPPRPRTPDDLSRLVAALREASRDLPRVPRPWLPPLPDVLAPPAADPRGDEAAPLGRLALGVADLPAEQAQPPSAWDLARDGCLLVVGTTGSGRSGVLRAVAREVARRPPDRVHLHVLDGDGGLRDLAALPHAGTVVDRTDPDRTVRLLELVAAEVTRRRALDAGDLAALPWVVVLVDGADALLAGLESHAAGRGAELLGEVVRSGPGARVVTCVAGGRAVLGHRVTASIAERLVLRMADPADLLLAGVPTDLRGGARPPGRAVRLGSAPAHKVQIARADPVATWPGPAASAGPSSGAGRRDVPPLRVPVMPGAVALDDITGDPAFTTPPVGWATVGVGGDDVRPLTLDLRGTCALVSGPPASGRSTALATLAAGLAATGRRVVAVAPRGGPLAAPSGQVAADTAVGTLTTTDGRDADRVRELLGDADAVLVDDPDALAGTPAEALLLAVADGGVDRGRALVVAGSPTVVAAHPGGLAAAARRSRQGLVLCPEGYADGDVLGVTLPRGTPARPGRGYLVRDGRAVRVQVATPPRGTRGAARPEPRHHDGPGVVPLQG